MNSVILRQRCTLWDLPPYLINYWKLQRFPIKKESEEGSKKEDKKLTYSLPGLDVCLVDRVIGDASVRSIVSTATNKSKLINTA